MSLTASCITKASSPPPHRRRRRLRSRLRAPRPARLSVRAAHPGRFHDAPSYGKEPFDEATARELFLYLLAPFSGRQIGSDLGAGIGPAENSCFPSDSVTRPKKTETP